VQDTSKTTFILLISLWNIHLNEEHNKGIESLPQTLIFYFIYLWKPVSWILDISNLDFLSHIMHSLKYIRPMTKCLKDIEISKSDFVAKPQFLWKRMLIKRRSKKVRIELGTISFPKSRMCPALNFSFVPSVLKKKTKQSLSRESP